MGHRDIVYTHTHTYTHTPLHFICEKEAVTRNTSHLLRPVVHFTGTAVDEDDVNDM